MDTTIYTRDANELSKFVTTTDKVFIMSEADRLGTNQGIAISYSESPNDYTIQPYTYETIIPYTGDYISLTGGRIMFEEDILWLRTPGTNGNVKYASTKTNG